MNQRYQPITRLGLGGTGLGDMYHTTSDEAARTTVDARRRNTIDARRFLREIRK